MRYASRADVGSTLANGDVLPRRRLADRLAGALDAGSLLLIAPAGYGKTTALAEAVGLRRGSVVWMHCSEADRDAGRLLIHLVAGVREAVPGAADVLGDRLHAAHEPIDPGFAVRELARELGRLLVDPLTLIVDDAEHLSGAVDAERLVADLLAADFDRLRVAVAARRPLTLRAARLRAAGKLTHLGPADLAFGVEECGALLCLRWGREPAAEEAEAMWTATEGWPLGVALAARSDRALTAGAARAGALDDYLAEELLDPLEPALRDALIDSSVARELDPALVRALGLPDGFLADVRRQGIPLRAPAHDGDEGKLAYHPLVRDVLAGRLARERPAARRAELHAVVAEALQAALRGSDAVEHWLAAGRYERAGEQVARHGEALLATAPATAREWLERLPDDIRAGPGLRLLEGRLASGVGRMEEAEAPLREAVAQYTESGEDEHAWTARAVLADSLLQRQEFDAAVRLARGYESSRATAAPLVALSAAAALAGAGRYREASKLFSSAGARCEGGPLAPLVEGFHGFFVDLPCGRLDAALAGVRATVAQLERDDPFSRLPHLLGMAAAIHDDRGETGDAIACFVKAERVAARTVFGEYVDHFGQLFRASIHARARRFAEAESALAAATGQRLGWFGSDVHVTRALIAAHRRAGSAVDEAVARATAGGAHEPWHSRLRTTALLAPALVAADRAARARDLLDRAIAARPPLASCARLLALRAWMRSLDGDEPGALEDLSLAWAEAGACPQHLVRCERGRLEPLLWTALERGTLEPDAVIAALEASAPGGGAPLRYTRHPVPSVRRCAVLASIASGHPGAAGDAGRLEGDPDPAVAAAVRSARARFRAAPPPLEFTVLGGFGLRRGSYTVDDDAWPRRAAQRLVRMLILRREAIVDEDALFAALWPDKTAPAARRNLQVAVSTARAVLDWPGAAPSMLLVAQRSYRLALSERDVVDAEEFERAATAALAGGRIAQLREAARRWTGEPLPEDRYEDWAAPARERLIDVYGRVLAGLATACSAAGDHPGAVDARRRHVELDPLDEAAQRGLMLAYARAGRRGHALRQYLACRRALVDGLGIEPAHETGALQRLILAGEPV